MVHVKRFAHPDMVTVEEEMIRKRVRTPSRLAETPEQQINAAKGHPVLRNEPVNRAERRKRKFKLDKAHGRGFTKSSKEGRRKRHAD